MARTTMIATNFENKQNWQTNHIECSYLWRNKSGKTSKRCHCQFRESNAVYLNNGYLWMCFSLHFFSLFLLMIDGHLSTKRACQVYSPCANAFLFHHFCPIALDFTSSSFLVKVKHFRTLWTMWTERTHTIEMIHYYGIKWNNGLTTFTHYHINWNASRTFHKNQLSDWLCSFNE